MEKILLCFGTRPEWLKIKPLIKELNNYKLLFTGQHPDLLRDIKVDYRITIGESDNRLDQLISDCLLQFPDGDFDSVLVQGDTASAFACAVAAFNRQKKIYYLEAGLRSYNLQHPYPEEGYRQMIARISDINLCPTELSKDNLISEKVSSECYVVGNTVLDNLVDYKKDCQYTNKILVTLHRRENHHWMSEWFTELNNIAKENPDLEFILPIHPNPNVQKHREILTHVNVIEPLGHTELLKLLVKVKFVISDSGGLQEEGSFFNKKVIVCRKTTERPEGINTGHLHICKQPKDLKNLFKKINQDFKIDNYCPYGNGQSAKKIKNTFELRNIVQVYGLPRSGTNLMEWSLTNLFKNIGYINLYKKCDVKGLKGYNKNISLKHSYPTLDFSDKCIIVIKDLDEWKKSYLKWSKLESVEDSIYHDYIKIAKSLNSKNSIIINHKDLVNNFEKTIKLISKKLNIKLSHTPIVRPINYLDKGGSESKPMKNRKFDI